LAQFFGPVMVPAGNQSEESLWIGSIRCHFCICITETNSMRLSWSYVTCYSALMSPQGLPLSASMRSPSLLSLSSMIGDLGRSPVEPLEDAAVLLKVTGNPKP
jgi:hypothetical protein